jgi:hypothetical protein
MAIADADAVWDLLTTHLKDGSTGKPWAWPGDGD